MNKFSITATIFALATTVAAADQYPERQSVMQSNNNSGFYLGLDLGRTSLSYTDEFMPKSKNYHVAPSKTVDVVFVGYNVNPYAAVELGYIFSPSEQGSKGASVGGIDSVDIKHQGFLANIVGKYPLPRNFSVYGKIGVVYNQYRYHKHYQFYSYSDDIVDKIAPVSFAYGAGIDYAFAKGWHVGLDYYHINKQNKDNIDFKARDNTSLRILYQF